MNIITKLDPKMYSGDEMNAAFMRELRWGMKLEKATEKQRTDRARLEARRIQGKRHPVLGECVATIPAREYFRMKKKYGEAEVHSDEFIKYFQKTFSDLSPNKI